MSCETSETADFLLSILSVASARMGNLRAGFQTGIRWKGKSWLPTVFACYTAKSELTSDSAQIEWPFSGNFARVNCLGTFFPSSINCATWQSKGSNGLCKYGGEETLLCLMTFTFSQYWSCNKMVPFLDHQMGITTEYEEDNYDTFRTTLETTF